MYAASTGGKHISLVIVNKDVQPVALAISNVPAGKYFMRHFGGSSGVYKWQVRCLCSCLLSTGSLLTLSLQTTITLTNSNYLVVPAYAAVFLQQQ